MTSVNSHFLQLMLITADPDVALYAEQSGVDRMFIDMEFLGKQERQKNLGLPLNQHTFEDIKSLKKVLRKSEVMVRINPPNPDTGEEVKKAVDAGADCIMLPYFTRFDEVEMFLQAVNGQCKTNLLLETAAAVARAESIFKLPINEVHFGLNDLKLTFKLDFLYETLSGGIVDFLCNIAKKNNISYGFGGVGSLSKGADISPELIIKEHVRLNSKRVILSRAFTGSYTSIEDLKKNADLESEVHLIREAEKRAHLRAPSEILDDQNLLNRAVFKKVYG